MSFTDVLAELPKLTPEQRDVLRVKLAELTGEEWMDDGELTPEQKALVEQRLAEHERNPSTAISWEVMETRLKARYGL
jgi:putative addiction module component (TIGR02574 family)